MMTGPSHIPPPHKIMNLHQLLQIIDSDYCFETCCISRGGEREKGGEGKSDSKINVLKGHYGVTDINPWSSLEGSTVLGTSAKAKLL